MLKLLGNQIRTVREAKGMVQDEAAYACGLSRSYYADVERGARNISAMNLMQISKGLEIDTSEFFPSLEQIKME